MATLQGKAVKNTYRQVLQIGANNVGVSGTSQRVQDGAGVNTALSLSTIAATIHGDLTITGDLIITGGGIQIQDLIDDTVASLIQNGTGITWTYNDGARTLTGNFTGTTSVVAEGSNLYYTQARFDSAFAAKSTTNLTEGANLYFTTARGDANFATNFATKTTTNLPEGSNLYFTNVRARTALSVTGGTGISYDNTTGVFNLAAIPNASLANSSITINGQSVSLGGTVTLTTTNIAEGTNLYWTEARGNANFATNLAASSTTNLAEGTNLYYTQARFDTAFSNKSTTNLAEGANLYYTQARFNSALAAKSTTDLAEGSNLYYTDTRARLALSSSATGLSYANNSGVFSLTAGYAIPTTAKLGQYDTAYNRSIISAAVSGTTTKTLSLTQQDTNVVSATWTDLGITTINGTVNQIAATTVANTTTLAFTNDVTMPNNLVVSGNLTINGTATYVNTQSISAKDPLFEVANDNNTTDVVDIGYYGRYYDTPQTRVEFTGLFRDASDAGKFKFFTGLVDEPTNVVNTTGTGYTVGTLVANFEGNLAGTANAANALSTARTIAASGDAVWSVSFDGSANVTSALTLANTGVTASTYGTSTAVPTIAIDGKGRITSASNTNIAFPVTTVNGFAGTVVLTTSDVAEGTNQYFTTARAQASITGGASSVVTADLTASRALVSDGSGKIAASATTTTTEIGYLAGVTSAIQTQLNGKLNLTGGTLTGGLTGTTGSFSGILTTPQVKAATSAGLSINANSGTQVADFGAGGSANITFFGGLSGTSATFSSDITSRTSLNASTLTNIEPYIFLARNSGSNGIGVIRTLDGGALAFDNGATGASQSTKITLTSAGQIYNSNAPLGDWAQISYGNTTSGNSYGILIKAGSTSADTALQIQNTSNTHLFKIRGDGNIGIGNSNPQYKLVVSNNGALGLEINPTSSGYTEILNYNRSTSAYQQLQFTASSTVFNNNVLIGNTTNYWQSPFTALDISNTLSAACLGSSYAGIYENIYYDGSTYRFKVAGYGTSYVLSVSDGGHSFATWGTGAAGAVATGVERMKITSGGYTKMSNNGTYLSSTDYHEIRQTAADWTVGISNTNGNPRGIYQEYTAASPNGTGNQFLYCSDSTALRFAVRSNGGIANYQANNVNLSDERTKKDIIPLESYWDKFKAIEIVKFKYKDQTHDDFNIGVIAQQVESIAPEFIDADGWNTKPKLDEDGNEIVSNEEPLKSVYTADLHHATIKVLQEAMAKIETLEAKIAILEAK